MMKKLFLVFRFTLLVFSGGPGSAQDSLDPNAAERLALAQKMHEIRPINIQVEDIIQQMAQRYPEDKRAVFTTRMMEVFDKKALTDISVKAMADTFTVAELKKMIDFHGSPEGNAISEKMPVYQGLVEPELVKKIDKALMVIRTGDPAP